MKLDIGCGPFKQSGCLGVDLLRIPGVDVVADATALPFAESSIEYVHSRSTLEHIPALLTAIREFYRVCRDGATVELVLPHFSSYEYYRDPTHLRSFSIQSFDYFDRARTAGNALPAYLPGVDLEVIERKLIWWDRWQFQSKSAWKRALLKALTGLIEGLANVKPFFCERFWCYYVGGFVLVSFRLRVHKPGRTIPATGAR